MESLKGKFVLLTGATGSIGSATVKLLKETGANLFISGRNANKLKEIAFSNGIAETQIFAGDLSNPEMVIELHAKYAAFSPVIDILINASGIGIIRPIENLSNEDFLQSLHVNVYGPFLLMKAFLPMMKEAKKGLIINIPGVLGKAPMAGAAAYSASKYALTGMMQSIREELKRTEIRITNLFLGGTDSHFWDTIDLRVQRDKMVTAAEAAKAIWFLCQQPRSGVVSEMVLQPFNHQVL